MIDKLYLNYFSHSKMAISEHKNGHFEEIRGWLQILELGSNSTIFYLLFDTHDSPGAVFIWKWEIYRPYLLVWYCSKIVLGLSVLQFWWLSCLLEKQIFKHQQLLSISKSETPLIWLTLTKIFEINNHGFKSCVPLIQNNLYPK